LPAQYCCFIKALYAFSIIISLMQKKIIVIDDDQDILEFTEFILQDWGYEVVASLNADILDDILQLNPDLILVDDWLEDTTGHEQCEMLKSAENTKHIPVVIFSASTGLQKVAEDCHADNYIEKPFDVDHLQDVISALLHTNHKLH
jgi:two-component system response regulator VicR